MSITFIEAADRVGVALPAGLIADAEVPVISGLPQRQGDVLIAPRAKLGKAEKADQVVVSCAGVQVVRGENGGNTHWLHADGPVTYAPAVQRAGDTTLGILDVPTGATAYLIHTDEHGTNAVGEGTYVLRGKVEQAEELRRVAD